MRYFVGIILIFVTGVVSGQTVLSKIPANGDSYSAFVPTGYDTLAIARGDLNNDKLEDLALVLKSLEEDDKDKDPNVDPPGRLLVILFKSPEGYKMAAKSDSAILCAGCGGMMGDPFHYIVVDRSVLTIHHYGGSAWRWSLTHKFRFQKNDFYLIGETEYSHWNVKMCDKLNDFAGVNLKDVNYLTGQFQEKEITEECKLKVNKKGKRKVEPLKKLGDFSIEN
jgi:hypothetical protein